MSEQKVTIETVESIDFSPIEQRAPTENADWEAPPHVYDGKRLPNGKSEKEPVYTHQEYPRLMYGRVNGKAMTKLVNDDDEFADAIKGGWHKTPAGIGIVTAPSFEEAQKIRRAREEIEPETSIETVEIVKRGPGRPRKAA